MDDKKKMFLKPEAEIVEFVDEDIITVSVGDTADFSMGEDF